MQASTEQMLLQQELTDANVLIDTYGRSKETKATQTLAVDTASCGAQADAAAAANGVSAPERPTASRVQRRSLALDVTGLAREIAPEGVGAGSVGTRVLGTGLLKPTVCSTPAAPYTQIVDSPNVFCCKVLHLRASTASVMNQ